MGKIGYIQKNLNEQELAKSLNTLIKYGCVQVYIEDEEGLELTRLLSNLEWGMELVVCNFASINKRTNELALFLNQLSEKEIAVYSIEEKINSLESQNLTMSESLNLAIEIDLAVLRQQRGQLLSPKGRRGELGRPSLTSEKINEIIFYHNKKKMSYREISELTGVALGTVHKYIKQQENNIEAKEPNKA
ncbi:hypothetical protein [Vagococcus salmoninarum]|uniref:hypothetical protein n=1 Tax=Vagococcus salmoninarum TaxID=2739 RepID=UPI003F99813B